MAALGRRWALLVGGLVLSLAVGIGLMAAIGTSYTARSAVLLVQPQPGATAEETLLTQQKLNLLAFSYAEIVQSRRFIDHALKIESVARRGASVSGETVKSTSTVVIRVRANSASAARNVADAVTSALTDELDHPTLDLPSSDELDGVVLEEPRVHRADASRAFALLAALVAGLALSVTAAVLLETP